MNETIEQFGRIILKAAPILLFVGALSIILLFLGIFLFEFSSYQILKITGGLSAVILSKISIDTIVSDKLVSEKKEKLQNDLSQTKKQLNKQIKNLKDVMKYKISNSITEGGMTTETSNAEIVTYAQNNIVDTIKLLEGIILEIEKKIIK